MTMHRYTSVITDYKNKWWNLAPNCIVAYQPKGSKDYAESLINLANPGVYTPVPDGNAPAWDKVNGWIFASANTQSLSCGFTTPVSPCAITIITKFTNATAGTNGALFGQLMENGEALFAYAPFYTNFQFSNGGFLARTGLASGVVAIAGSNAYENGLVVGSIGVRTRTPYNYMHIGGWRYSGGIVYIKAANVQAFAYYSTVLTADQVLNITAAMNAL